MKDLRHSILIKYLTIYIIFILIPVIFGEKTLAGYMEDILVKDNIETTMHMTSQISNHINATTRPYVHTAGTIINDSDIMNKVSKMPHIKNTKDKLRLQQQLEEKLASYFNYTTDLIGVLFSYKDGGYYYYKNPPKITDQEIRSLDWYQDILESGQQNIVIPLNTVDNFLFKIPKTSKVISFAAVSELKGDNQIEMVYFAFNPSVLRRAYSELRLPEDWALDVITQTNNVVYTNGNSAAHLIESTEQVSGYQKCNDNGKELLLSYQTVPNLNWKVIVSVPYKKITGKLEHASTYFLVVFLILSLIFFLVFFGSTIGMVMRPVRNLIRQTHRVEKGEFDLPAPSRGKSEIDRLNQSFFQMVERLKSLLCAVETKEKEKVYLELQSLQYQINPHFLFNTLNSITTIAENCGADNVTVMSSSLTKLLYNTLEKSGSLNTVEQSFDLLRNYEAIMSFRYPGRFEVTYRIEEGAENALLPKMLVQPILENAIIHGLKDAFSVLHILVIAKVKEDTLMISVEDDGVGMAQEQINELLASSLPKDGFNRIGIFNIHRRLQLNYGEQYGISILSKEGEGVKVIAKLPYCI
ncbi:sensor histidine kinase [Lachnoclostridium sp.]|uniref:sensor histidine kinase n=1 Tax=Lachnoclostridium sp. TaxID=2028282 RepID=UPI0028989B2A|nr:histidine kinase [Lachnoclostridium sp.]